jgi:hypothetical protein
MTLKEYLSGVTGKRVLATADAEGKVDALLSTPSRISLKTPLELSSCGII